MTIVIGAGVIGLTSGIRLAEAGQAVTIVTADSPDRTTSRLATAMVGPTFAPPGDRMRRWEEATVRELVHAPAMAGVHECAGRFAARPADLTPPFAAELPGFRPSRADERPEGFGSCFWLTVLLVDMVPYLAHLVERFEAAGGTIERRVLGRVDDALLEDDVVVNCGGLGARHLVPDDGVVPVRGPKIVVANPGLDTFFIEAPFGPAWASYHPHGDRLVLGGAAIEGREDVQPDADEATAVIDRCAAVEPRLADATVLSHEVGLRPGRAEVRLEAEDRPGRLCVHNYGHAGIGVTVAWGCAGAVADLVGR